MNSQWSESARSPRMIYGRRLCRLVALPSTNKRAIGGSMTSYEATSPKHLAVGAFMTAPSNCAPLQRER
jgi:hypothetical protein